VYLLKSVPCRTPAFLLPKQLHVRISSQFILFPTPTLSSSFHSVLGKEVIGNVKMSAEGDKRSVDVQDAAYGINESSENVDEKKGNAADRADMYRMGKTQEMTVRRKPLFHNCVKLTNMTEKLSLSVHLWLLHDSYGVLGVLP
jgi:hypothetical protein